MPSANANTQQIGKIEQYNENPQNIIKNIYHGNNSIKVWAHISK